MCHNDQSYLHLNFKVFGIFRIFLTFQFYLLEILVELIQIATKKFARSKKRRQ